MGRSLQVLALGASAQHISVVGFVQGLSLWHAGSGYVETERTTTDRPCACPTINAKKSYRGKLLTIDIDLRHVELMELYHVSKTQFCSQTYAPCAVETVKASNFERQNNNSNSSNNNTNTNDGNHNDSNTSSSCSCGYYNKQIK